MKKNTLEAYKEACDARIAIVNKMDDALFGKNKYMRIEWNYDDDYDDENVSKDDSIYRAWTTKFSDKEQTLYLNAESKEIYIQKLKETFFRYVQEYIKREIEMLQNQVQFYLRYSRAIDDDYDSFVTDDEYSEILSDIEDTF
ncbi:hypothetical protein [Flavobacterium gilvum]|nr:hypothetical protein [Flavobacterium gilvum]KFC57822.1 hypothetical protein FEM08_33870 [Flavobacterium gilvum]